MGFHRGDREWIDFVPEYREELRRLGASDREIGFLLDEPIDTIALARDVAKVARERLTWLRTGEIET